MQGKLHESLCRRIQKCFSSPKGMGPYHLAANYTVNRVTVAGALKEQNIYQQLYETHWWHTQDFWLPKKIPQTWKTCLHKIMYNLLITEGDLIHCLLKAGLTSARLFQSLYKFFKHTDSWAFPLTPSPNTEIKVDSCMHFYHYLFENKQTCAPFRELLNLFFGNYITIF